ncbi:hypothetical protein OIU84_015270 [Salix udensis]|uniref:Association with the SNF1 complex (ASC) domain-containing protein n=1 Tax=Salix udensis TaxID=889485 RepID=A0AAD6NSW0_9ROSI|nr:hypothetical protein OIU84_015270 [Salix udensis]
MNSREEPAPNAWDSSLMPEPTRVRRTLGAWALASYPRLLLFISFIRGWEHCKLDEFVLLTLRFAIFNMSNQYSEDPEEATVVGFEVPRSPDSSYNNVYPGNEDEVRDPPSEPPHLQHSLLSYPASADTSETLPLPQNVILNHLYIENREAPRSVVALGFTHRFHSKFVTVVLYKPVQRRGKYQHLVCVYN